MQGLQAVCLNFRSDTGYEKASSHDFDTFLKGVKDRRASKKQVSIFSSTYSRYLNSTTHQVVGSTGQKSKLKIIETNITKYINERLIFFKKELLLFAVDKFIELEFSFG